jgi:FkbM family methyltransferase
VVNKVEGFVRRHPWLRQLLALPRAVRRSFLATQESRAQEVMDRLLLLVEEDIVIRVDEFNGVFTASPRSDLLRRIISRGSYEPTLSRLFLGSINPDLDIIDVGANIGFYTIGGAKKLKGGRVFAAEPTPGAFARLQANVERNQVADRVILFKGLISAKAGNETLKTIVGREEYSSTGPMTHPSIANDAYTTESVQAAKLDDLVSLHQLRPGLMKVDVEGAEAQVFAGASEMLARFRPTVLCEVSNQLLRAHGVEGRDIVQIFERLDYKVVDPHDPRAEPGTADFGDIFCAPRER